MAALSFLLDQEFEKKAWRIYTADVLAAIAGSPLCGIEVKPFRKIFEPEDTRTGEEIMDDVFSSFEKIVKGGKA